MNYLDIDVNNSVLYVNKKLDKLYIDKKDKKTPDQSNVVYSTQSS